VVVQVLYSASIFNRASKRQESSRGVWGMVNIKNKIGLGSAKKEEGRKKLFKIKRSNSSDSISSISDSSGFSNGGKPLLSDIDEIESDEFDRLILNNFFLPSSFFALPRPILFFMFTIPHTPRLDSCRLLARLNIEALYSTCTTTTTFHFQSYGLYAIGLGNLCLSGSFKIRIWC
jgi:hypothetical protein